MGKEIQMVFHLIEIEIVNFTPNLKKKKAIYLFNLYWLL